MSRWIFCATEGLTAAAGVEKLVATLLGYPDIWHCHELSFQNRFSWYELRHHVATFHCYILHVSAQILASMDQAVTSEAGTRDT